MSARTAFIAPRIVLVLPYIVAMLARVWPMSPRTIQTPAPISLRTSGASSTRLTPPSEPALIVRMPGDIAIEAPVMTFTPADTGLTTAVRTAKVPRITSIAPRAPSIAPCARPIAPRTPTNSAGPSRMPPRRSPMARGVAAIASRYTDIPLRRATISRCRATISPRTGPILCRTVFISLRTASIADRNCLLLASRSQVSTGWHFPLLRLRRVSLGVIIVSSSAPRISPVARCNARGDRPIPLRIRRNPSPYLFGGVIRMVRARGQHEIPTSNASPNTNSIDATRTKISQSRVFLLVALLS